MSIEYAILGILSRRPMSGYDLKKQIRDSPFLYWSGNNNQVYKALTMLREEGYVDGEVFHQDSLPSKKVYTITPAGLDALKHWVAAPPEPMELKKPFLVRLAWAGLLNAKRIDALLTDYERQVRMQMMMASAEKAAQPDGTALELLIQSLIDQNVAMSFESELKWIRDAREAVRQIAQTEGAEETAKQNGGDVPMYYEVVDKGGEKYLHYRAPQGARPEKMDATQYIADCGERRASRVMLDERALPASFFDLKTGLAGELLQKLAQYRIRAALVIEDEKTVRGRFREMLTEANQGDAFHSFANAEEAERWLLGRQREASR